MTPFDFVNAINMSKKDLIRGSESPEHAEKFYVPYVINRTLSNFVDTIMYANEMNLCNNAENKLQNDYYLNSVRVSKRFSKWAKPLEDSDLDCIQQYFKVGYSKAVEIKRVLTRQQIDLITKIIIKGSNNVQHSTTGGGQT